MSLYPFGAPVVLDLKKSDGTAASLGDYATVTLHITKPDGTTETHSGVVSYTYLPAAAGRHVSWWTTTVPTGATDPEPFDVTASGVAALVSLEDVKAETNITSYSSDAELHGYIFAASAVILNHPAYRVGDVCQVQDVTEWHDGNSDMIILGHYPVDPTTVDITEYQGGTSQVIAYEPADGGSFTGYGWTTDDGTGQNGILRRTSSGYPAYWSGRVKVTYTAGTASVPADIWLAALALVDHLWEMQRGGEGQGLPSGSDFEDTGSFASSFGPSFALPNRVKELLEPYRRKAPAVA